MKIAIVIPLYNKADSIQRTLECLTTQTFQDFEVVIVNDGSTDGSDTIVRQYLATTALDIRLIDQPNGGVSHARNRGAAEARTELIAFLDADDRWDNHYLQTQYNLTEQYPECSVFATAYRFEDHTGKQSPLILRHLPFAEETGILSNYFEVAAASHPPLWTSAIMVRKTALEAIGGFPVGVTLGEDLLTWTRLALHYSIAYSRKTSATYCFRSAVQLVTPRRAPDANDLVGDQLKALYNQHRSVKRLNVYCARWQKMRMVTYIRLGMRNEALREAKKIIGYGLPDKKTLFWILLLPLPHRLVKSILLYIAQRR